MAAARSPSRTWVLCAFGSVASASAFEWFREEPFADVQHRVAAVCVAGELRTMSHPHVQANWEHALSPLRADLFVHASPVAHGPCVRWNASLPMTFAMRKRGCIQKRDAYSEAELDALVSWLRPLGLVQALIQGDAHLMATGPRPAPAAAVARANCSRRSCADGSRANAVRPVLGLRWYGCLVGIERSERELRRGARYAYVLRTRPDYYWNCVMTPAPVDSAARYAVGENDFLWIAPRELAGPLLETVRHLREAYPAHAERSPWLRWLRGRGPNGCGQMVSCRERSECFDYTVCMHGARALSTCPDPRDRPTCTDYIGVKAKTGWSKFPPGPVRSVRSPAARSASGGHYARHTYSCYMELMRCRSPTPTNASCWERRKPSYARLMMLSSANSNRGRAVVGASDYSVSD